jgi:hypothetical protein
VITDATGRILARRDRAEGPGFAIADVTIGRVEPTDAAPSGYWLHERGLVPALFWAWHNRHGRHWYARHARHARGRVTPAGPPVHEPSR